MLDSSKECVKTYAVLERILTPIHKEKVKLENEKRARAVDLFTKVRDDVQTKLKENGVLFRELPTRVDHRGSYFGGVKVQKPDEFDVDIALTLPLDYSKLEIKVTEPGFVSFHIREAYEEKKRIPTWAAKYNFLESIMDSDGYLSEELLRTYTESVLTKAYGSGQFQINLDGEPFECKIKKSGPAFTFCLQDREENPIDIDFVIVLFVPAEARVWPPEPIRKFTVFSGKLEWKNYWFAVPKPNNNARSWRLSFPMQEEYVLYSSSNLKACYRLMKTLRSCEKWNICSYHIATLFLWESHTREQQQNLTFWNSNVGFLFVYFLEKLAVAMEDKELLFFWDITCNMLKEYNPSNLVNMRSRMSSIIKKINANLNSPKELELHLRKLFQLPGN